MNCCVNQRHPQETTDMYLLFDSVYQGTTTKICYHCKVSMVDMCNRCNYFTLGDGKWKITTTSRDIEHE